MVATGCAAGEEDHARNGLAHLDRSGRVELGGACRGVPVLAEGLLAAGQKQLSAKFAGRAHGRCIGNRFARFIGPSTNGGERQGQGDEQQDFFHWSASSLSA